MKYKKKTVLIVGGSGFLGKNLCIKCLKRKFKVITLSSKLLNSRYKKNGQKHIVVNISNKKIF